MKNNQDNPYETPQTVSEPTSAPIKYTNTWRLGAWLGFFAGLAPVIGYYAVFVFGWLNGGSSNFLLDALAFAPVTILIAAVTATIGGVLGVAYDSLRRTFF